MCSWGNICYLIDPNFQMPAVFRVIWEVTRQMLRGLHWESKLFTFYSLGAILKAFASYPLKWRGKPPGSLIAPFWLSFHLIISSMWSHHWCYQMMIKWPLMDNKETKLSQWTEGSTRFAVRKNGRRQIIQVFLVIQGLLITGTLILISNEAASLPPALLLRPPLCFFFHGNLGRNRRRSGKGERGREGRLW